MTARSLIARTGTGLVAALAVTTATVPAHAANSSSTSPAPRSLGRVYTTGSDTYVALGDGQPRNDQTGLKPLGDGVSRVRDVAVVNHALALRADGTMMSWGTNFFGNVDGQVGQRVWRPIPLSGPAGVTAVETGYFASYALDQEGSVWSWGNNTDGILGLGDQQRRGAPERIQALPPVAKICPSPSGGQTLALTRDGRVFGWGVAMDGQLGPNLDPSINQTSVPIPIPLPGTVVDLAYASDTAVVTLDDGSVWAWGSNRYHVLGTREGTSSTTPVRVSLPGRAVQVATTGNTAFAVLRDGSVVSWGNGSWLGRSLPYPDPYQTVVPRRIGGLPPVRRISAASGVVHVVDRDGALWGWGYNARGSLGDGTQTYRRTPVSIPVPARVIDVASGETTAVAVDEPATP